MSGVPFLPGSSQRDVVVTVHGLLAGRNSMRRLGRVLDDSGYETHHWVYPSLRGSILSHASKLSRHLCQLASRNDVRQIHLVSHSMGAAIARAALAESRIESRWARKCGAFVMLAPPNGGSWLTRIPLGPFASWFPQLSELSEREDSLVRQLPMPRLMRVGVIAASRDLVVSLDATHLTCQRDHATVHTTHQRLIRHPAAIEMSVRFVQQGRFQAKEPAVSYAFANSSSLRGDQRRRVHSSAA